MAKFIRDAVTLVNTRCYGNLSMGLVIRPDTQQAHPGAFQKALEDLRYGAVVVNGSPIMGYAVTSLPWGGWAAAGTPQDMSSGNALNANTLLYDHVEKGVLYLPWVAPTKPVYFPSHTNLAAVVAACVHYYVHRGVVSLHQLIFQALGSK